MANATMAQIRAAIDAVLTAHYSALGWNHSAYLLASPTPPCMDIASGPVTYDLAMAGGADEFDLTVRCVVAQGLDVAAQAQLDSILDTRSTDAFKTVLEANYTLSGTIAALRVTQASELKMYPVSGGSDLMGCEFTVAVYP